MIFVVAVAWIGGELAYVLIASFAILIAMSAVFRSKQRQVHAERKSIDGRRFSFFAEFLSKMHVIKSNCMETPMLRRYEVLQGQSVAASKRLITVNGMSQAFSATMSQATLGAIALAGAIMVINGSLGIAELAACTLLSGRAIQPMFKVTGMWVQGESASLAKQRCAEVLALPQRRPKATDRLVGALRFEDVTVTLKGRADPLFQSVSFGSHPGECIALTGDDGVGKTTFLRLILGEQTPSKGRVLLDGRPAHDFLRARGEGGIAYLDQKPIVFETSILQNMTLSHDPARAQKVIQLSEKLGLSEAVNRLPDGYETLIGGKGATPLPEGTLQLIALVRALSTSPKILLFNEANTAMDSRTDEATQKALFEIIGHTTMVIVTRRPSYVAMANKQINLTQKGVTINHLNELKFRFTNQRSVSFEQPLRQSNDPGATETDVRKPVAVA